MPHSRPRAAIPWPAITVSTLLVLVLAAAVYALASRAEPAVIPSASVDPGIAKLGQPAPLFSGTGIDGGSVDAHALRGKVLLVNFFASWCTNCRAEFPALVAAQTRYASRGFSVIGVNTLETGDGPGFFHSLQANFPAVRDPGSPGRIGAAYTVVTGLPATFLIGRDGRVADVRYGQVDAAFIDGDLARLL